VLFVILSLSTARVSLPCYARVVGLIVQVVGYVKKQIFTDQVIGAPQLSLH
jgi:hypothetical protein